MKYIVTVNNKNYEVEVEQGAAQVLAVTEFCPTPVQPAPESAPAAAPVPVAAPAPVAAPVGAGDPVPAPMPGTILAVYKRAGDPVKAGEVVLLLEAMKMENEVVATKAGTISQVLVTKGSVVTTGDPLVTIV